MNNTVFTPSQIYLLRIFEHIKTEHELDELKQVVGDYYAHKMDSMAKQLWEDGTLNQERLDEINKMDLHAWMRAHHKE